METPTQTSVSVLLNGRLWTWSIQDGVLYRECYTPGEGPMSHSEMEVLQGPEVDNVFLSIKKAALGEIVK